MASNTIRPTLPNSFDRSEKTLREDTTALRGDAKAEVHEAGQSLGDASAHAQDAFKRLDKAGDDAARATLATADGAGHFLAGVGYSAEGVAHATADGAGRVAHIAKGTVQAVSRAASRFFEKIAKVFAKLGNENMVTTRSVRNTDDALKAFYELQGQMAKAGFSNASAEFRQSWNSWSDAMVASLSAGGNVLDAAKNLGLAAASVSEALGHLTVAGAADAAALTTHLAEIAVDSAQQGVIGAADLAAVSAKFFGATANAVSLDTQPKIEVALKQQTELLRESLNALAAQYPALRPALSKL